MYGQQALQQNEKAYEKRSSSIPPFRQTLSEHGLKMDRGDTNTLQINVGLLCNQTICRFFSVKSAGSPGKRWSQTRP